MLGSVQRIPQKGFGLVANRDICVGECILEEEVLIYSADSQSFALAAAAGLLALSYATWQGLSLGSWWSQLGLILACSILVVLLAILWDIDGLNEEAFAKLDRALRVTLNTYRLGPGQQVAYFGMCGKSGRVSPFGRCLGIFDLNSLTTGDGSSVFVTLCRLNHDCTPNANPSWHADKKKAFVHALRAIKKGEEITISYGESFATQTERQKELKYKWLFDCRCETCSLSSKQLSLSDSRRSQCNELRASIQSKARFAKSTDVFNGVEALLALIDEEFGTALEKTELCVTAYQVACATRDVQKQTRWAAATRFYYEITRGQAHPDIKLLYQTLSRVPKDSLEKLSAASKRMQSCDFLRLCDKLTA